MSSGQQEATERMDPAINRGRRASDRRRPPPTVLRRMGRFLGACFTFLFLIGAGGVLALLCSYLMRQFGY